MKFAETTMGRTFIIRLEDGDILNDSIEAFARKTGIARALVLVLGGADSGSRMIVGPEDGKAVPPVPVTTTLTGVHEFAGVGTIFPDETGEPSLHLHISAGRGGEARTGCARAGVSTWRIGEVVVIELSGRRAERRRDAESGFELLEVG